MSSERPGEWTTITARPETVAAVDDMKSLYSMSSKDEAIRTLLQISDAAGIPIAESYGDTAHESVEMSDVETVAGFLFTEDTGESVIIGRDGKNVTAISDVSEAQSPVQPMARTNITEGNVICPACGTTIMGYSLSESLPGIETGVFNEFDVHCTECNSQRPYYTLFVAQPGAEVSSDALEQAMTAYFAYVLVLETFPPDEFSARVTACKSLADDGGWVWLPDPSQWIGFTLETVGAGPVTPRNYCEFLQSYLQTLIERVNGTQIIDISVISPANLQDQFTDQWEIQVETRGATPEQAVTDLQSYMDAWESVSVDVRMVETNTFADDTFIFTLNNLE